MKSLFKSQLTLDTTPHNHSNSTIHNCPTCRCPTPEHSATLSSSRSQPFLRPLPAPNLYLSTLSPTTPHPRKTPTRSPLSPRINFNYSPSKSPPASKITFSYISPPKTKKHHSSESRFNTRRFKDRHFPHLHNNESDHQPVKKIIKNNSSKSPYYELFTTEKTPEKHKILKMNKSKQKLEITLSKKSSKKSIEAEQEVVQPQLDVGKKGFNDYEFNDFATPRGTPINGLWMGSQKSKQDICSSSQIIHYRREEATPPSIENIKQTHVSEYHHYIIPQIPTSSSTYIPANPIPSSYQPQPAQPQATFQTPTHRSTIFQTESNRLILPNKSPTIESVQVYEAHPYLKNASQRRQSIRSEQQTSLNLNSKPISVSSHKQIDIFSSQRQLARSISEQLQLHFDYYSPHPDSDRSLSLQVTL